MDSIQRMQRMPRTRWENKKKKKGFRKKKNRPTSPNPTQRWLDLRERVLKKYGHKCMRCGSTKYIQVDHIRSKSTAPHLQWKFDNLQVLCAPCNKLKSWDKTTDYRPIELIQSKRSAFIDSLLDGPQSDT